MSFKNLFSIILVFALFVLINIQCKQTRMASDHQSNAYTIADQKAAAKALVTDDSEHFFDKLQALDVAIQLKDNAVLNDAAYLSHFKTYLVTQADQFTLEEAKKISSVADTAMALMQKVYPGPLPHFQLAKIKTDHYGDDVYYTRGNTIFIPANIFNAFEAKVQLPIMIHELWHVMSEMQPTLRSKMYALIGFHPHGKKLVYPEALRRRLLTNPDGAHDEYAINLLGNKKALPIILSGKEKFDAGNPAFFNHLRFELYGIDDKGKVECHEDLSTSLTNEEQASFFKAIKDNTQYIIHPDEIIADNVMLAVLANHSGDYSKFNKEGKMLIDKVLGLLRHSK